MRTVKSIAIALFMLFPWIAWKLAGSRVVREGVEIRIIGSNSGRDKIDVRQVIDEDLFHLATTALNQDFYMNPIGIKVYISEHKSPEAARSSLLRSTLITYTTRLAHYPKYMEELKKDIAAEIVYANLLFDGWLERNGVDSEEAATIVIEAINRHASNTGG